MKIIFITLSVFFVNQFAQAKRMAPKPVEPISSNGLRYEAPHWAFKFKDQGMKHNGGYIRVINDKSGVPICLKQVYEVTYKKDLESDIQDNFITKLEIRKNELVISSEKKKPVTIPLSYICN